MQDLTLVSSFSCPVSGTPLVTCKLGVSSQRLIYLFGFIYLRSPAVPRNTRGTSMGRSVCGPGGGGVIAKYFIHIKTVLCFCLQCHRGANRAAGKSTVKQRPAPYKSGTQLNKLSLQKCMCYNNLTTQLNRLGLQDTYYNNNLAMQLSRLSLQHTGH